MRPKRVNQIALLAALLSACRPSPPGPTELVLALASEPQSLDPRFGADANASRMADLLHVALTRADAHARRVPDLAARWDTPDATTVVFHLRPDFRFADGTRVTAADVRATYEAVLDPVVASPKRGALAALAAVEAPDPTTVVMRLREPFAPFLDATGLGILPAGRVRDPGDVTIGAGPFRLVQNSHLDGLLLAPNPGYPRGPVRLDPLRVRIVPDDMVRTLELARGTVHLVEDPTEPELTAWLGQRPDLTVRVGAGSSVAYVAFNHRDPRLRQRRVRLAIAHALDRDALVRFVLGNAARPATGLLAPEHWAYAPAPAPRYDPRRAARLLDRAGFPDPDGAGPRPRFRIVYKTSNLPSRRRLAEAMQADLARVGIALDVRSYEWGTLFADVRHGRFEACTLAWVGIGDPDLYHLAFHSAQLPPAGYNRGAFADRVVDRLTVAGRRTLDPERRHRIYARLQRRAAHDLPVIPLWWEDRVVVQSRRLEGFVPSPHGDLHSLAQASMRPPDAP